MDAVPSVAGFSQISPDLKMGKSHGTLVQLREANGDLTNIAVHKLPTSATGCGFFNSRKSVPMASYSRVGCSQTLGGMYQSANLCGDDFPYLKSVRKLSLLAISSNPSH